MQKWKLSTFSLSSTLLQWFYIIYIFIVLRCLKHACVGREDVHPPHLVILRFSWPWFHLLFSMFSRIFIFIFFGCSEHVWIWKDMDGKNSLTGTWSRKVVILSWLSLFLSKVNWSIVCQLHTKELSSVVWVVFGLRLQPSENQQQTKKKKHVCFLAGRQRWFRPRVLCSDWLTCIMQVLPWGVLFCHQRKIHYSFITSA